MQKISLRLIAIFFVLNVVCTGSGFAQQTISPEKKALIQEVLQLSAVAGFRVNTQLNSTNFLESLTAMFENDSQLSDAHKSQLRKLAFDSNMRIETHVNNFNDDKKNSLELFSETGIDLLDKAFTEDELKEMVIFYRTPTGQKSAKFMVTFVSKLTAQYKETYNKRFNTFFKAKVVEEVDLFKKKLAELKGK